ncbi:hypothetical protein GIS00_24110 [Nakamurella sp. YIM 132087]|uniref:Uncharacterized protein n=1 Tax=Nakamurella alba TaxID=2665158 RepID=A0A7K1FW44_9ACTN|nr:hypothetical protein [Nakamurella alba]MTD17024.1 hypothetical protein [Nakamurella alba]
MVAGTARADGELPFRDALSGADGTGDPLPPPLTDQVFADPTAVPSPEAYRPARLPPVPLPALPDLDEEPGASLPPVRQAPQVRSPQSRPQQSRSQQSRPQSGRPVQGHQVQGHPQPQVRLPPGTPAAVQQIVDRYARQTRAVPAPPPPGGWPAPGGMPAVHGYPGGPQAFPQQPPPPPAPQVRTPQSPTPPVSGPDSQQRIRVGTPVPDGRKKTGSGWAFLVIVLIVLFASGLGTRLIDLVTELFGGR